MGTGREAGSQSQWAVPGLRAFEEAFRGLKTFLLAILKILDSALAGVVQGIEHGSAKQRVAGPIPSQGTCLGCGPGPQ